MSSLSNQQFNTKTMTGISDTYSDNIICDTLEVINDFTVDDGGVINLPDNSIQDSYLSSNVALLNRNQQTFTGVNNFTNNITSSLNILCTSSGGNGTVTRLSQTNNGFSIVNNSNSQFVNLQSRTSAGVGVNGVVVINGNTTYLQGDNNNRLTITASTTPTISTQAPALSNDLSLANTAWVNTKLGGYAQLAGTQTFTGSNTFNTGTNTFNSLTIHNATLRSFGSIQSVFPSDFRLVDSTQTYLTQMYQNGTTCVIDGNYASSRLTLTTRTASNVGLNNLLVENGNRVILQGSSSEIDITGTSVNLNGQCSFTNATTPIILGTILNSDNSTKIATTAFVKNQSYLTTTLASTLYSLLNPISQTFTGDNNFPTQATNNNSTLVATTAYVKSQNYITSTALTPYALLAPATTQTFTGATNVFDIVQATTPATSSNSTRVATTAYVKSNLTSYATIASLSAYGLLTTTTQTWNGTNTFTNVAPSAPIQIKNTVSANSGGLFITGAGNYNSINSAGDFSVIGFAPTIDNGTLTLCTWASNSSGIKITQGENRFYNPFGAWYNSLATVPPLNVYDIGYNFSSFGATWNNWTGFTTPQNVVTLTFNGVGSYKIGTYLVDVVLITNLSASPNSQLIWTDVSGTSDALNSTCTYADNSGQFGAVICQIMRMSFVLQVTTTPSTYYLNYKRIAGIGAGLSENKTNSKISFTRMG
jgi:hypothetical protein